MITYNPTQSYRKWKAKAKGSARVIPSYDRSSRTLDPKDLPEPIFKNNKVIFPLRDRPFREVEIIEAGSTLWVKVTKDKKEILKVERTDPLYGMLLGAFRNHDPEIIKQILA